MLRRLPLRPFAVLTATMALASCRGTSDPEETWVTVPTAVITSQTFTSLSLGDLHSCGLLADGQAFCWGLNSQGQSGNGVQGNVGVNTPLVVIGGFLFSSLSAGGSSTCGILKTGVTACWGNNEGGQLGTGNTVSRFEPTPVAGEHQFVQISNSTLAHACGVTAEGEAWCWGVGLLGRLGNGTVELKSSPTLVSGGLEFKAIATGGAHTCALTTTGTPYCWGYNARGQLGDGTNTDRTIPVGVSTTLKFTQIVAGVAHTCALTENGDPYCWGDNIAGALGDGSFESKSTPTPVEGGPNFTSIVAGERHTCGLAIDGNVQCWGYNDAGALGDGTLFPRSSPVLVKGNVLFQSIAAGAYHTCGISQANLAYCWGDNFGFQLGIPGDR